MSSAVLNLCYGIELNLDTIDDEVDDVNEIYNLLKGSIGVLTLYDAFGNQPYKLVFGSKIVSYSEGNSIRVATLNQVINQQLADLEELHADYKSNWNNLDDEVRQLITEHFGDTPALFFIWSNT